MTGEGGRRNITKREAIVTQLVNRSATADLRALKMQPRLKHLRLSPKPVEACFLFAFSISYQNG